MDSVTAIILGFLIILLASILERYCEFGRQARDDVKPWILKSQLRYVLEAIWILLLVAGAGLLLFKEWILAIVGIIAFWAILPFMLTPFMRYRLLPHWDDVKKELEPLGLTQKNYWREDWWMVEKKSKKTGKKKKR